MSIGQAISGSITKNSLVLLTLWTFMVALSLALNFFVLRREVMREAATEARAHLDLNSRYRKVISSLGGLYASPELAAPNPYLAVPRRDVVTTDGQRLTLINGAYFMRLVFDPLRNDGDHPVRNRIVSQRPLNPANAPDPWEGEALGSFEQGNSEASRISSINGKPHLRLMKPFRTEESCLKCHRHQGYAVGDTRGGISVSVPLERYYAAESETRRALAGTHGLLWLVVGAVLAGVTRKRGEQERRFAESERKFRILSESSTDWIFWMHEDGRFAYLSPSTRGFTGHLPAEFEQDPGLLLRIIHPDDRKTWQVHLADFRSPEHKDLELRIVSRSGETKWISHVCAPIVMDGAFLGRRASNRDISDRRMLEEQLRQAQKMEAVGLLAGGISHDFNNILTAIIGYGNIVKLKLPPGDPLRGSVEQILAAAGRAARLTEGLLAYSRSQTVHPRPLDLNDVVARFEVLLSHVLREDITLQIAPARSPLVIMADRGQIEQVLMNLATNARDAMPRGGILTIATDHLIMDDRFIRTSRFGRPGDFAVLRIADTGTGMDKKVQERMFDPFFTTKEPGQGTGLGLSMVYGAVEQNNGYITVKSDPGKGSVFSLYFPLVEAWGARELARTPENWERGTGTVLVTEDDPSLRKLLCMVLNEAGYTTIEAADGAEAVQRFRAHQGAVDLLILDMIMPRMSGREVFDELKKEDPSLKALFLSGYAADSFSAPDLSVPDAPFLSKPVSPQDLLLKVREALGPPQT